MREIKLSANTLNKNYKAPITELEIKEELEELAKERILLKRIEKFIGEGFKEIEKHDEIVNSIIAPLEVISLMRRCRKVWSGCTERESLRRGFYGHFWTAEVSVGKDLTKIIISTAERS